jgi:hypothetical protein
LSQIIAAAIEAGHDASLTLIFHIRHISAVAFAHYFRHRLAPLMLIYAIFAIDFLRISPLSSIDAAIFISTLDCHFHFARLFRHFAERFLRFRCFLLNLFALFSFSFFA